MTTTLPALLGRAVDGAAASDLTDAGDREVDSEQRGAS
jgi:hypothetical protein